MLRRERETRDAISIFKRVTRVVLLESWARRSCRETLSGLHRTLVEDLLVKYRKRGKLEKA